jgi:hypothetical protein
MFVVAPKEPLMDDGLSIQVSGLPSDRLIAIRAKSEAKDKLWWKREAVFNSGPKGTIDLSAQAPVSGSCRGIDAMGLFWSMKPERDPIYGSHAFFEILDCFRPVTTQLEATDTGRVLGFVTVERRFAKPGIRCADIKEGGIRGFLCDPGDSRRHPGVMLLGGSEGGPGPDDAAALLASRGFTVLSLAYFNAEGPPPMLRRSRLSTSARRSNGCARVPKRPRSSSTYSECRGVRKRRCNAPQCIPG